MADTNLAKKANGYNYKYTELAQINEYIESIGGSYYQYIETTDGVDYIITVKVDKDGKESKPLRGSRIIDTKTLQGKSNPAQELGSGITYARRYSLLMAYGLATEDDDASNLTTYQNGTQWQSNTKANTSTANAQKSQQGAQNASQGYSVNNPTAKDVEALAKDVAANLTAESDKDLVIRIFNQKLDDGTKKNILNGLKLERIEDISAQVDIDKVINNYKKWGLIA